MIEDMDEEMKEFLQGLESQFNAQLQGVEERTTAVILAEISNLRTETQRGWEKIDLRLESIDSRLKLQAGLLQAGSGQWPDSPNFPKPPSSAGLRW